MGLILVLLIQSEKLHGLSFNINYYETNLGKKNEQFFWQAL